MKDLATEKRSIWIDGKQTSLRFDPTTWQAIELLALRHGTRWTDWVRAVLARHPGAENMHAILRSVTIDGLLAEQLIGERAAAANDYVPPLMRAAGTLDDGQFGDELTAGHVDYGPVELGGFTVRSGIDQFGRACIWIENLVKGWPHYAIPLPFTAAEVAEKVGDDA